LSFIDRPEVEHLAQTRGRRGGRQRTRGRQLGRGIEDPADQKRKNEVAASIAIRVEKTVETDLAGSAECGSDVAVRQASRHGEGVTLGGDDGAPFEHAAQPFDVGGRPVRQVAEGAFADPAVLAIALAQQNGRR
jgi:hypothetical protein